MKQTRGFTLIELVIVIAILGVLAGIAIPRFLDAQASARGAKIIANLRTIDSAATLYLTKKGTLPNSIDDLTVNTSEKLLEPLGDYDGKDFIIKKTDGTEKTYTGIGGPYAINSEGRGTLGGNTHTVDWFLGNSQTQTMGSSITDIFNAIKNLNLGKDPLDSGAAQYTGSNTEKLLQELKAQGIDLSAMGAESWKYVASNKGTMQWSTVDISKLNQGDKIPMMQYRADSGNFTVWIATVAVKTNGFDGNSYNVIGSVSGKVINPDGEQTYEKAVEYYNATSTKLGYEGTL